MARSRNIKPGFFTNADLLECQPLARLLFIGLWCEADRRGILEDRPKTLKIKILPGDNCDADALLDELAGHGFIQRYAVGEVRCILIPNFERHQNPHVNERPNSLPAPEEHGASTVQAPEQHQSTPADSLLPLTDSLVLNPDSGFRNPDREDGADAPRSPAKRAAALSDDFTLSENDETWANEKGFAPDLVASETERFRLHYRGNGKPMKDWHATWKNWMLKSAEFRRHPSHVNGRASPRDATGEHNLTNAELMQIIRGDKTL